MVAKKDTSGTAPSRATPGRRRASRTAAGGDSSTETEQGADLVLMDAIDDERHRLMQAEALLDCALMAMDEDEACDDGGPYYPAVVELARTLVNESIERLDSVHLKEKAGRSRLDEDYELPEEKLTLGRSKDEVRDVCVAYLS